MQLYVDMDGTLNRLQESWCQTIRFQLGEELYPDQIHDYDRLGDAKYLNLLKEPGYFLTVPVQDGAQQAIQVLQADGHEIYIVTAATEYDYADKHAWLRQWFPSIPTNHVIATSQKHLLAKPDRILIDDAPPYLEAWERAGGVAICYSQSWNRKWNGLRVQNWHEALHVLMGRIPA